MEKKHKVIVLVFLMLLLLGVFLYNNDLIGANIEDVLSLGDGKKGGGATPKEPTDKETGKKGGLTDLIDYLTNSGSKGYTLDDGTTIMPTFNTGKK